MTTIASSSPQARRSVGARIWAFVKRHVLTVYAVLVVGYLMLPIAVVILFSFNHPTGRFNYVWNEFTFDNWLHWNDVPAILFWLTGPQTLGVTHRQQRLTGAAEARQHREVTAGVASVPQPGVQPSY